MASLSLAATTVKGSKSNGDNRVSVYTNDVVSEAQAAAILAEMHKLDKGGRTVASTAGQVTEILKRLGIQADRIKKIFIPKPDLILLLADQAHEAEAMAFPVQGGLGPGNQPAKPPVTPPAELPHKSPGQAR